MLPGKSGINLHGITGKPDLQVVQHGDCLQKIAEGFFAAVEGAGEIPVAQQSGIEQHGEVFAGLQLPE